MKWLAQGHKNETAFLFFTTKALFSHCGIFIVSGENKSRIFSSTKENSRRFEVPCAPWGWSGAPTCCCFPLVFMSLTIPFELGIKNLLKVQQWWVERHRNLIQPCTDRMLYPIHHAPLFSSKFLNKIKKIHRKKFTRLKSYNYESFNFHFIKVLLRRLYNYFWLLIYLESIFIYISTTSNHFQVQYYFALSKGGYAVAFAETREDAQNKPKIRVIWQSDWNNMHKAVVEKKYKLKNNVKKNTKLMSWACSPELKSW